MVNMRSKLQKETIQSGISNPKLLKHPGFIPFSSAQGIKDLFCYIIEHYGNEGLSALIYRQPKNDNVVLTFGDWCGNTIDINGKESKLTKIANEFVTKDFPTLLNIMRTIKMEQAQLYFVVDGEELVLTDMQLSLNKFASPGMIKDIFGKICRIPTIKKIEIIDDRVIEHINKGVGTYSGDIILKPSRFRMFHNEDNTYRPFYVEVVRQCQNI